MIAKKPYTAPVLSFGLPFEGKLSAQNRWAILSKLLPWAALDGIYTSKMCADNGRPALPSRLVLGALLVKHQLNISDEDTILQIQENVYLQYFVGLEVFQTAAIFDPSLFVAIRKRLGEEGIIAIEATIVKAMKADIDKQNSTPKADKPHEENAPKADNPQDENAPKADKPQDENAPKTDEAKVTHRGHLKIDATVAPQKIKYPTDLDLLNTARQKTEKYITLLCLQVGLPRETFRTYRRIAYKEYLKVAKKKNKKKDELRGAIRKQLNYLKRNLLYISTLIATVRKDNAEIGLEGWREKDLTEYDTIQKIYTQQKEMYDTKKHTCKHRIVSISQPYVRPIVRGKAHCNVEFGAKIGIATTDGITTIDQFSWEAYNETNDFEAHITRYKALLGYLPETINGDRIYLTRKNRAHAQSLGIRVIGKPLGRPKATDQTAQAKRIAQAERNQRNAVEGKIGQAKNRYGLDKIAAKTDVTTRVWVRCCMIATNLTRWLKAVSLYLFKKMSNLCQFQYNAIFALYRLFRTIATPVRNPAF